MADRSFIQENEAARSELSELIACLDERSFGRPVGSEWTSDLSLSLGFLGPAGAFLVERMGENWMR